MIDRVVYMMAEDKIIEEFNTAWLLEDFINAYLNANGISDDEFSQEKKEDFFKRFNKLDLNGLRQTIIQDINERLCIAFSD